MTQSAAYQEGYENGRLVRTLDDEDGEPTIPLSDREWVNAAPDGFDDAAAADYVRGCNDGYSA